MLECNIRASLSLFASSDVEKKEAGMKKKQSLLMGLKNILDFSLLFLKTYVLFWLTDLQLTRLMC